VIVAVACRSKSFHSGLQLRVQLRYCTGFPFQTLPEGGSWSPRRDKSREICNENYSMHWIWL